MVDPRPAHSPTAEEQALRSWVVYVAKTDYGLSDVIYRNQRGPRPVAPYCDIQVLSEKSTGEPYREVTNTVGSGGDYKSSVTQHYNGTVNVTAYGPGARDVIRALTASIQRGDVKELNRDAGVNVVDTMGISNAVVLLDTDWEQRATEDFRFTFAKRYEYETQGVEEVIATIKGETGQGDFVEFDTTID